MCAKVNENFSRVQTNYLFSDIGRKVREFQTAHPDQTIFRLGIGDATQPLGPTVVAGMQEAAKRLGQIETFTGYGDESGNLALRQAISAQYAARGITLGCDEIFIGDGAKTDVANVQSLFGLENVVAIADPAYPVYVDTSIISGRVRTLNPIIYMKCTPENNFVPEVPMDKVDIIYLCSPNNPTGAVMTKRDLGLFVDYAREEKAIILFDAAYSSFISDPNLPRSIYEIPGADQCAIELNSFSKSHGFTGVRLGWTVVPKKLVAQDETKASSMADEGQLNAMWRRRQTTFFNGASNIVQAGGLAGLTPEGLNESRNLVSFYMENARLIVEGLTQKGLKIYGGTNAPFLWMQTPNGMNSWGFFDKLLNEAHVVGTPGSGFGAAGEGYFRLSAFGHRDKTVAAIQSIHDNLRL